MPLLTKRLVLWLLLLTSTFSRRDGGSLTLAMAVADTGSFPTNQSPPVVVCGAGPASLFFTLRYLQLEPQARVEIYEKRAQPLATATESAKKETNTGFRAFGFGLGARAQAQLRKVAGLAQAVEKVGEKGAVSGFWFVNHRDLCAQMTSVLVHGDNFRGRCTIHYECPVTSVDTDSQTVAVTPTGRSAEQRKVPFSLLVAGDGSNSIVRQHLEECGQVKSRRFYRNLGWKALQIPAQPDIPPGKGQTYGAYAGAKMKGVFKNNFGGLLPRFKQQFVLLMFWRKSRRGPTQEHVNPFQAETAQDLKAAIAELFPNVSQLPPDSVLDNFLQEPHGVETYMKVNRHAIPQRKIALIGDAAAGMYSTLGQGVASAWERAAMLAEMLHQSCNSTTPATKNNMESVLSQFSRQSRQQAHAATTLNLVSHLREIPWLSQFFLPGRVLQINAKIMDPQYAYTDLARQYRPVLWAAQCVWRFQRVPFTLDSPHNPLSGGRRDDNHSSS